MKTLINQIQNEQLNHFYTLTEFINNKPLATKRRGLYWLWTNLDFSELKKATPIKGSKEVPIDRLVEHRDGLNNITNINKDGFKIVYNGIGGYKKTPAAFGLRERINQEITCNDYRTGTLNLARRFKPENWAISFFDFDDEKNKAILKTLKTKDPYADCAKDLENLWRLEFGTPILCRH